MGKVKNKTHKATAKRFKETASGKLKYTKQGNNHLKSKKSNRELRRKKKQPTLSNKTEEKKLKQLMHG